MDKLDILEAINGTAIETKRLDKLDDEQRTIVLAREQRRIERAELIAQARKNTDPEVAQHIFDQILHMDGETCEHDRSLWGTCNACHEIDVLMFPEVFCQECWGRFFDMGEEDLEHKDGLCTDCAKE